jgi:uncharacterized protein YbjQ (UPF0145 family)
MNASMVTMAMHLDDYRIAETLGVVRGIVVRSRSVVGLIGARLQTVLGGNITLLAELCERARADAFAQMIEHAELLGAHGDPLGRDRGAVLRHRGPAGAPAGKLRSLRRRGHHPAAARVPCGADPPRRLPGPNAAVPHVSRVRARGGARAGGMVYSRGQHARSGAGPTGGMSHLPPGSLVRHRRTLGSSDMANRKAKAGPRGTTAARKAARRKSNLPPGISRIDQESTRTHGYFVRLGYRRTREGAWRPKHRQFFGDVTHGGKAKGLKAAIKWLKGVLKK